MGMDNIFNVLREEPDKPYLIGSQEYAYEVLPYIEAVYPETKLYEFNNIQYICVSDTAKLTVETMLRNTIDKNRKQIKKLYEQNACAEQQLYGTCKTITEHNQQELDDYELEK